MSTKEDNEIKEQDDFDFRIFEGAIEERDYQNNFIGSDSYGWVCPRCKSVYAPHVKECKHCNPFHSIKFRW